MAQIFTWIVRVCEDRKGLQSESLIIAEVDRTKKIICDIIPAASIKNHGGCVRRRNFHVFRL